MARFLTEEHILARVEVEEREAPERHRQQDREKEEKAALVASAEKVRDAVWEFGRPIWEFSQDQKVSALAQSITDFGQTLKKNPRRVLWENLDHDWAYVLTNQGHFSRTAYDWAAYLIQSAIEGQPLQAHIVKALEREPLGDTFLCVRFLAHELANNPDMPVLKKSPPPAKKGERKPGLQYVGIGLDWTGKWFRFTKSQGDWRQGAELKISKGQHHTLLKGFAEGNGHLERTRVNRLLTDFRRRTDPADLQDRAITVVSELHSNLRRQFGFDNSVKLWTYDTEANTWNSVILIGRVEHLDGNGTKNRVTLKLWTDRD